MDDRTRLRLRTVGLEAGGLAPLVAAASQLLASGVDLRAVVLVEGDSDRAALQTVARRRGRDLHGEGVAVPAMGGATNLRRFLQVFGPAGIDVRLAGLYDEQERDDIRAGLGLVAVAAGVTAGVGASDRQGLAARGFHACIPDLEGELIRALGADAVERVIDVAGELGSLRRLQQQPAQQGRPVEDQLHRFLGSRGGRKVRYARLLIEALQPAAVPGPLDLALSVASSRDSPGRAEIAPRTAG